MSPKANNLSAQSRIARITVRLFTIAIFIGFFAMSQASVKAVTVWSDSWIDDSASENSPADASAILVVGCGVTEATYDDDWELQSVKVTTTLRSPNGRTATLSDHTWSNRTTYSAIAEPKMQWDWNDTGDYLINSHHYSTCPPTELGHSSALATYLADNSFNEEDFGFWYESSSDIVPGERLCFYKACPYVDTNPTNNCYFFSHVENREGICDEGKRIDYRRVKIPIIGIFTHCIRVFETTLYPSPCPGVRGS